MNNTTSEKKAKIIACKEGKSVNDGLHGSRSPDLYIFKSLNSSFYRLG